MRPALKQLNDLSRKADGSGRNFIYGQANRVASLTSGGVHLSRIVEERHEAEVHVQLLVAVEKRHSGIVGNEVKFKS